MELEKFIDHTLLKPTAQISDIERLCFEAIRYNFFGVCVHSSYVSLAKKTLKNSPVKVVSVVGFPLGAMAADVKVAEALFCIENGADEIDMVINLGLLKSGLTKAVEAEIIAVKKAIGSNILKVIIESCYLTDQEIEDACNAVVAAKADFVKTSTGFGTHGATLNHVALIKKIVKDRAQIKASGGIKNTDTALEYIKLGVTRIGTSSGIAIVSNS
jgi:deoxyribose-phosphate aldolase